MNAYYYISDYTCNMGKREDRFSDYSELFIKYCIPTNYDMGIQKRVFLIYKK